MWKKVLARAGLGFPAGVFIGYTITIIISMTLGTGEYLPVSHELAAETGSVLNAVIAQYLLAGLLGAATAAGSLVWTMENWSITRMTVVHFLVLTLSMLPLAWFSHWMQRSASGVLGYLGIFLAIYLVIWLSMYLPLKRSVARIARKMRTDGN